MPVQPRLLILPLLVFSCLCASAQTMSIHGKRMTMHTVFDSIYIKTGLTNSYNDDLFPHARRVTLNLQDVDVRKVVQRCVAGTGVDFTISNGSIHFSRKPVEPDLSQPLIAPASEPNTAVLDKVFVRAYGKTTQRLTMGSVTEVDNSVIRQSPDGELLGALEGRVPGMFIRQLNGVPGSARQTLIRGQRSIEEGNRMLIVIDGVPLVDNDGYVTTLGSGSAQGQMGADLLNGIALDDIASVEILKDASATAIYGSRGANGVLLITLKSGKAGKLRWNAAVSGGVDAVIRPSKLMNTTQYLAMRRNAIQNDGLPPDSSNLPEAFAWDTTRSSNYQRLVMGQARWRKDATLGLSGGDSNTVYLVEGTYHREEAVFPASTPDERMSVFGRLQERSTNKRLRVDVSAMEHWENNRLPQDDYSLFQYLAPDAPAFYGPDGKPQWSLNGLSYFNIPASGYNSYRGSVHNEFGHLEAGYAIIKGLELRSTLGYYRVTSSEHTNNPVLGQDPATNPTATTGVTTNSEHSEMLEEVADFQRKLGPGVLEALLGANWQEQRSGYTVQGDSLAVNSVVYRYEALFGRLNYNIDNRYIAEVSGRRDGSSLFGPGDQFGNFWATSGVWIFSEEPWLKRWSWLSHGKLRASLGTTGNDQIDASYAQVYSGINAPVGYQGSQGLIPASLPNNNLRWEVNYNSEIATDLGFLRNRILFSAAYYRDWTTNQLMETSLPTQAGQSAVYMNMPANVVNRGVEMSLRTVNYSGKDWSWISTLMISAPLNKLKSFPGLSRANAYVPDSLVVGKSLTVVKGPAFRGVSVDSGLFEFGANVAGGNMDPRYYGGLDQVLRFKHWEMDVFVEFRRQEGQNPYVILYQLNMPGQALPNLEDNVPVEFLHRWRQPGDRVKLQQVTEIPYSAAGQLMQEYTTSTARSIDASFIRLKSLGLAYRLTNGRIWIKTENLFTWTHYPVTDPETQNPMALPPVKTVAMGLQLNF